MKKNIDEFDTPTKDLDIFKVNQLYLQQTRQELLIITVVFIRR